MSLQVEIDQISFGFESSSLLFEGFSLSVVGGGAVALVGESGSGKSTLLNLIAGLEIPNSGSIKVFNTRLDTLSSAELNIYRRDRLGFIFQTFHLRRFFNLLFKPSKWLSRHWTIKETNKV